MIKRTCLPLFLLLGTGCHISIDGVTWFGPSIKGSGVVATEIREVAEFDRIELHGSLRLVCRVGGDRKVTVTGDDNLLAHVNTELDGHTLVLGMESGSYSYEHDLVVSVVTPHLVEVSVSGSADADVTELAGEQFDASVSGSGSLRAAGLVERVVASVSGSGDLKLEELQARDVRVSVSGSGDADVYATQNLDSSVSGSGEIRYRGEPHAKISVSGSGSVNPRQ